MVVVVALVSGEMGSVVVVLGGSEGDRWEGVIGKLGGREGEEGRRARHSSTASS